MNKLFLKLNKKTSKSFFFVLKLVFDNLQRRYCKMQYQPLDISYPFIARKHRRKLEAESKKKEEKE